MRYKTETICSQIEDNTNKNNQWYGMQYSDKVYIYKFTCAYI